MSQVSRSRPKRQTEPDPNAIPLSDLPQEVLLHIFTFLFVEDLLNIGAVCRVFRAISKDNNLSNNYRRNVNVSFIGSSGAGKSTLAGHLHLLLGEAKQADVREAAQASKDVLYLGPHAKHAQYTFLANRRKIDRQTGVTTDNNYLHVLGSGHPLGFTFIDTPGHRDYFRNTIRGFLQSDMAVWVVDQIPDPSAPYPRTNSFYEAPLLVAGANMRCAVVVVNKMDERDWSTSRFDEIKIQLAQILLKRRVKTDGVMIVPVSSATGWNILHRTIVPPGEALSDDIRTTYQGPTLWEAIVSLAPKTPKRPPKKPFRMSVVKMWNTILAPGEKRRGVILGTVLQGGLKVKQQICLSPTPSHWVDHRNQPGVEVWGIGAGKLKRNLAPPGYLVALLLPPGKVIPTNHKRGQEGRGWVAYNPAKEPEYSAETRYMIVQVILFAGASVNPAAPPLSKFRICPGYKPSFHFVSGSFIGDVISIHNVLDSKTKKVMEENPRHASGAGRMFTMTVKTKTTHTIEPYAQNPCFGRFFISDNSVIVGAGVVTAAVQSRMPRAPRAGSSSSSSSSSMSVGYSCEECGTGWQAPVAHVLVTPPSKTGKNVSMCANCFFEKHSTDPSICDRAYCPP